MSDQTNSKLEHLKRLRNHDWTHMMSDDNSVHLRGLGVEGELLKAEHANPDLAGMFNTYHHWYWFGKSQGKEEPTFGAFDSN